MSGIAFNLAYAYNFGAYTTSNSHGKRVQRLLCDHVLLSKVNDRCTVNIQEHEGGPNHVYIQ